MSRQRAKISLGTFFLAYFLSGDFLFQGAFYLMNFVLLYARYYRNRAWLNPRVWDPGDFWLVVIGLFLAVVGLIFFRFVRLYAEVMQDIEISSGQDGKTSALPTYVKRGGEELNPWDGIRVLINVFLIALWWFMLICTPQPPGFS